MPMSTRRQTFQVSISARAREAQSGPTARHPLQHDARFSREPQSKRRNLPQGAAGSGEVLNLEATFAKQTANQISSATCGKNLNPCGKLIMLTWAALWESLSDAPVDNLAAHPTRPGSVTGTRRARYRSTLRRMGTNAGQAHSTCQTKACQSRFSSLLRRQEARLAQGQG